MYRYFFRFVIVTLTILSVNLITTAVTDYMISYKNHYRPVTFTFLAMGITVVIFYPLFIKLEDWVKALSIRAVKGGKSVAGKYLGLLFTFFIALFILAYFYAKMWYHINLFSVILH
jgi:hypothetical protein